jgi:hypothetical protein
MFWLPPILEFLKLTPDYRNTTGYFHNGGSDTARKLRNELIHLQRQRVNEIRTPSHVLRDLLGMSSGRALGAVSQLHFNVSWGESRHPERYQQFLD